ncbi:MAG: hypothetical protein ILP18_09885 [Treponema sp.]|nr:hypothetical protein [Treponema sp.]
MAIDMTNPKEICTDGRRRFAVNIITALFFIASVPAAFAVGTNEFDERWMYFLNFARRDEYLFGRNVFFTYGPLGFLTCVRPVKDSLFRGLAVWFLLYGLFSWILLQVRRGLLERKISLGSAAVAAFLFLLPQKLAPDVLTSFYVLLTVALLVDCGKNDRRGILYALSADLLVAMLFLWKMSSFMASFAVCILAVCMLVFIMKEYRKALLLSLFLPFTVGGYLVYNPSFSDFLRYCRGALEISGGYNAVMGNIKTPESFSAFFVMFGVAAGLYLAVQLWVRDKKAFSLFLPLFLPLFFYYKHGIVRQGGNAFYQGVCMVFSICFLFGLFDSLLFPEKAGSQGHLAQKRLVAGRAALGYVFALCVLEFPAFLVSIPTVLKNSTLGLPSQIIDNYLDSVRNAQGRSLDPQFTDLVGTGSVAIFPDELFYLGDGSVQFKAMPVIQNYSAYTAWLDETNAAFFMDDGAPDFVLVGLESIDMRMPLAETPATYSAIREHYALVAVSDSELLFKRKETGPAGQRIQKRIVRRDVWTGSSVSRPSGTEYLSIDMKQSLLGKLSEFFWKALPVFVDITFDDGSVNGGRIVPRTAVNPVPVDELVVPYSGIYHREDGAAGILAEQLSGKSGRNAVSVDFRMKGLVRLFYTNVTLNWWDGDSFPADSRNP